MANTRADLRSEISRRLNDGSNVIWTVAELNGFIDGAIKSLYPTYFNFKVGTFSAGAGPVHSGTPAGCRNIYFVGLQQPGSTRVRPIRNWKEGDGTLYINKTGINGFTLVVAWTQGFAPPTDDVSTLSYANNLEADEVVILRVCIAALEKLLTSRVKQEKYFALTVREGVTEQDIATQLDALHASLQQRIEAAVKRPERDD